MTVYHKYDHMMALLSIKVHTSPIYKQFSFQNHNYRSKTRCGSHKPSLPIANSYSDVLALNYCRSFFFKEKSSKQSYCITRTVKCRLQLISFFKGGKKEMECNLCLNNKNKMWVISAVMFDITFEVMVSAGMRGCAWEFHWKIYFKNEIRAASCSSVSVHDYSINACMVFSLFVYHSWWRNGILGSRHRKK